MNGTQNTAKYLHDLTFVTTYGSLKIRVTTCSTVRNPDCEDAFVSLRGVNDFKLDNNIARARAALLELALCNRWDYFVTLTFDRAKIDRYSLSACYAALQQLVRSLRKQGQQIAYLFVPEKHKDGAWHFHGFLTGATDMRLFQPTERLPKYIRSQLEAGNRVFDWAPYSASLGWTVCEPVRNQEAAARYVTKYIVKDLARSVDELGAHLYYCSHGLQRSSRVKKGRLVDAALLAVMGSTGYYAGEHCTTYWFDYNPVTLQQLAALIL